MSSGACIPARVRSGALGSTVLLSPNFELGTLNPELTKVVGRLGFAPSSRRLRAGASLSKFATLDDRLPGPRREVELRHRAGEILNDTVYASRERACRVESSRCADARSSSPLRAHLSFLRPGMLLVEPSPFAERGEKVAGGRMRGAATLAHARTPSPQPSPLAPQRERELKAYNFAAMPDFRCLLAKLLKQLSSGLANQHRASSPVLMRCQEIEMSPSSTAAPSAA